MELRPYQARDVARLRAAMRQSRRVLYVAPTGSGKTVLFAFIARGAAAKGKRVLVLVHRIELVRQTVAKLGGFGVEAGLLTAGAAANLDAGVVVAAVQTLGRRGVDLGTIDLVVVDEAHHAVAATWRRVLDGFAGARVLGVTVTPERLDGRGLGEMFDAMVPGPEVAELTEQGYLAQARAFARLAAGEDLKALRRTGGDYDRKQLSELMLRLPVTDVAVRDYLALGDSRPAFVFCVGRRHAEVVAAAFAAAGASSASLDGAAREREREAVLERFANGALRVLASCDLLTEGFDAPEAAVALLLRPTRSLALHRQIVGRVLRPKADGGSALLLDYSGNLVEHGLPATPVAWSLAGHGRVTSEARCRCCPACGAVLLLAVSSCPECGQKLGRPLPDLDSADPGELVELDAAVLDRLRGLSYGEALAMAKTFEDLQAIALARGYKSGWAYHAARERGIPIPVTWLRSDSFP